jgi:chemotaxis protein histidine kinase CheA
MTSEAFRQQLAAMAAEYGATLPGKLDELDAVWLAARHSGAPEGLDQLRRGLHTMAGTAGTFGLRAVTDSARAAESFIEPFCASPLNLKSDDHAAFEALLAAVRASVLATTK